MVAGALQQVWDLRDAMGARRPTKFTPAKDAARLPRGSKVSGAIVFLTSGVLSDWDFTGYSVMIDGGQTVVFNNARFAHPGAISPILAIGTSSSAASADKVTCNDCEVDETGIGTNFESGVKNYGTLTLNRAYMKGAPRDYISMTGLALTLTDVVIESPGVGAPHDAHVESIHIFGGDNHFTRVFFDVRGGIGKMTGGWTSPLFVQAFLGSATAEVDHCVFVGAGASGSFVCDPGRPERSAHLDDHDPRQRLRESQVRLRRGEQRDDFRRRREP